MFPRQQVIGDFADINREQVNRHLADLEQAGLLKRTNRGWATCLYHLPRGLLSLRVLKNLTGLFPWLKSLPILALTMCIDGSGTTKRTPISQERLKLLNIYKLTGERGTIWEGIPTKRKTVNQLISTVNQNISANLGLTEYAMLLNTAFDDETLQIAYDITIKNKHKAKHIYAYFNGLCRRISEKMNKEPNYTQMYTLVTAAGFGPGCRTMLHDDQDAQPRYDKPQPKVESPELSSKASHWLKSFNSEKVLDKIKS